LPARVKFTKLNFETVCGKAASVAVRLACRFLLRGPHVTTSPALPFRHFLLALAVVAIWGSNFVVIRLGLNALPPLLFATLRFSFAVLPALFF